MSNIELGKWYYCTESTLTLGSNSIYLVIPTRLHLTYKNRHHIKVKIALDKEVNIVATNLISNRECWSADSALRPVTLLDILKIDIITDDACDMIKEILEELAE